MFKNHNRRITHLLAGKDAHIAALEKGYALQKAHVKKLETDNGWLQIRLDEVIQEKRKLEEKDTKIRKLLCMKNKSIAELETENAALREERLALEMKVRSLER